MWKDNSNDNILFKKSERKSLFFYNPNNYISLSHSHAVTYTKSSKISSSLIVIIQLKYGLTFEMQYSFISYIFSVEIFFKVGLSTSKKNCVICFIESPLKVIKNAFYFILKALFVLKVFKFLSWLFGHGGKTAGSER